VLNASYTLSHHKSDASGAVPTSFAAEKWRDDLDLFRGDADYGQRRLHAASPLRQHVPLSAALRP
jgi:hypothetical protein